MLEIKTVKKGAELISINLDGFEKMHDGRSFWNRHSPVLFPIVGKLKDGKTIIENKNTGSSYRKMSQWDNMDLLEIWILKKLEKIHMFLNLMKKH